MSTNEIEGPIEFDIQIDDLDKDGWAKVYADIDECIDVPETGSVAAFRASLAEKGLDVEVHEVEGVGIWTFRRLTEH